MPFGLKSAPEAFQRVTDVLRSMEKRQFAFIYFDDFETFL